MRSYAAGVALVLAGAAFAPATALADEGGVSFWVPGLFGSLNSVPGNPGWSSTQFYYHTTVSAGADVSAAREIQIGRFTPTAAANLTANLHANADLVAFAPSYTFATPVLGGRFNLGVMGLFGRTDTSVSGVLNAMVGPFSATASEFVSDSVTGFGDLYPMATLKWNHGVNNYMVYATGDIPVGAYDPNRLSNIGDGHGAFDAGAGYTYFDPQTGHEFSATGGFTANFINPSTQYQNGVDFHLDMGASQFLTKQVQVGLVGYVYAEPGCDSGAGDRVGCFQSRVFGVGPQLGLLFPVGDMQGYLNVKGYKEFDNQNRADGINMWVSFTISPAAPKAEPPPLLHK